MRRIRGTFEYGEAFHLATQGGAEVLGQGDVVGNFLPGKSLDALIINPEGVRCRSRSISVRCHRERVRWSLHAFIFSVMIETSSSFVDGRRVL